jgi:hypothetical protein
MCDYLHLHSRKASFLPMGKQQTTQHKTLFTLGPYQYGYVYVDVNN